MIYATTMALVLGPALDLLLGDPRWLPHPIRGIGLLIHALERLLRKNSYEKVSGCLLVARAPGYLKAVQVSLLPITLPSVVSLK